MVEQRFGNTVEQAAGRDIVSLHVEIHVGGGQSWLLIMVALELLRWGYG